MLTMSNSAPAPDEVSDKAVVNILVVDDNPANRLAVRAILADGELPERNGLS